MQIKFVLPAAILALVILALGCVSSTGNSNDNIAKCLTSKGAKMYGAYWCPHCQNQKNDFGSSFKYVDYTECDPNGPNANPEACTAAGIQVYPTWIINGTQYTGEIQLSDLARLAGC